MRSVSTRDAAILSNPAGRASHVRVLIKDAADTWRDVCLMEGRDFLDAVEVDENVDQPVGSAVVTLKRQVDLFSVSPLRADSKLNTYGGGQLVRPGREFRVEAACAPVSSPAASGDWRLLFHGDVDEVDFGDEQLVFRGRDLGGRLQDTFIEVERVYSDDAGVDVESVMQGMLDDNATGVQLFVPVSPGWKVKAFAQKPASVLDALRDLAQQIGWELRYRWRASTGEFALAFQEPQRILPPISWTFGPSSYRDVTRLGINRNEVRNKIEVVYSDAADLDPTGQPKRKSVVVQDAASIAAYRLRYMQIAEGASSNIDREQEARRMAEAALSDLKEPLAEQEIELDFFLPVELGDFYTFRANGVHYSADQNLAATAFRHTFTSDGDAKTTVTARGTPSFGVSMWLEMDTRPGMNSPRHTTPPPDPLSVEASPVVNGFALKVVPPPTGARPSSYELHVSTTNGFAPSSSTLRGTFDTTAFGVSDLTPGVNYFVRVVPRDEFGNRGNASPQVSVVPRQLDGASLADAAVRLQQLFTPPSDNLVPNGYGEKGSAALGLNPEGNYLVNDPVNALTHGYCRRVTVQAGVDHSFDLSLVLSVKEGDQFVAECQVKLSSTFAGHAGHFHFAILDESKSAFSWPIAAVQSNSTSYTRLVLRSGPMPANARYIVLRFDHLAYRANANDYGKSVFLDCIQMRRMVTFDLLEANTLRTSNYAEDGNGLPIAGAKLDNVGDALKVASDNVQVGRYRLSDSFFKSTAALADNGSRVFYRGNNDGGVRGGAPNIDRLVFQSVEGYAVAGAAGYAPYFTWGLYRFALVPSQPSDNLDAMRFMIVDWHWSFGNSSAPTWLMNCSYVVPDRIFASKSFENQNTSWGSIQFVYGDLFNRFNDAMASRKLYLKVKLVNAYGYSDERWFYPPTAHYQDMLRSATGPGGATTTPGGGAGDDGSGGGGTCVAPWEPVLLADGSELPADLIQPGVRVLTMQEGTSTGGAYEVVHVSRHRAARSRLVTEDGRVLVVTPDHRWRTVERGWTRTDNLCRGETIDGFSPGRVARVEPLDFGDVVKLTVRVAKTYVVKGLLAHNLKPREDPV